MARKFSTLMMMTVVNMGVNKAFTKFNASNFSEIIYLKILSNQLSID